MPLRPSGRRASAGAGPRSEGSGPAPKPRRIPERPLGTRTADTGPAGAAEGRTGRPPAARTRALTPSATADRGPSGPREERDDVIYGRNPVLEALKSGRPLNKLLIASTSRDAISLHLRTLAREAGVLIEEVGRERLDRLTSGNHQGVAALAAAKAYAELDDILARATDRGTVPLIVILDEVEDPHNLGAIIRTCDAVGADGVVIPQRRAVGLTETVAKSSAGAIEHVLVAREGNLNRTIDRLKEQGLWICAVDMEGGKPYFEADLSLPLAVLIGGEGKGVGRLLKERSDFTISIPMRGSVSSLNASVAAAVVLYETVRQRSCEAPAAAVRGGDSPHVSLIPPAAGVLDGV